MIYKVVLYRSEEGYSVSVPGLPGCCSQGATEAEATENIADAIREYLEVAADVIAVADGEVREVEVIPPPDIADVIEAMRVLQENDGPVLGDDLSVRDLIHEGRR
jgi:predicted RNase H-like HicB family nuclease